MKRRYSVVDDFFSSIDSEEKAYLLGFFLADGTFDLGENCTKSYRFGIKLQKEDEEIIKLFRNFIIPDINVSYKESYIDKNGTNHKATAGVRWTSGKMATDLFRFNICPRKTFDVNFKFRFDLIPDSFIWDFIRGFFDGDGQISYSPKTHQSTFALYGTSFEFMSQVGNIFESEFKVEKRIEGINKHNLTLFTLRFSANGKRKEFLEKLYIKFYLNKRYFLKRKQEKLLEYLLFKYRDNFEDCERLQNIVERRG